MATVGCSHERRCAECAQAGFSGNSVPALRGSRHDLAQSHDRSLPLEFWAAAEVDQPAYPAIDKTRRLVEPLLNAAFLQSSLGSLQCTLRYVPIVMPEDMHARYPARSKLRKKQRIYDCAPLLAYQVFVDGAFEDQVREYFRGIGLSAPHLADLGASPAQIKDFEAIMANVPEQICANRLDQTRH
jgi:hypothetical protein